MPVIYLYMEGSVPGADVSGRRPQHRSCPIPICNPVDRCQTTTRMTGLFLQRALFDIWIDTRPALPNPEYRVHCKQWSELVPHE